MKYFNGKVALITGAGSGIGKAICEELIKYNVRIAALDINKEACDKVVSSLQEKGGEACAWDCDVACHTSMSKVISEVYEKYQKIDFLFNNAGIGISGETKDYEIEDWRKITAVNIDGVINGIHLVYPKMIAQGSGHIINTASLAGLIPASDITSYCATKHAVVGLSHALRTEAKPYNVAVSVLCPGFVDTSIAYNSKYINIPEELIHKKWESLPKIPAQKFAQQAIKQIARKKMTIVIPFSARMMWRLFRLAPASASLFTGILTAKVNKKIKQEVDKS